VYKNKKEICHLLQWPQLNNHYGGCNNIYWWSGRPPFGTGMLIMIIFLRPTDFHSNLPTSNLAILDSPKCWCQCSCSQIILSHILPGHEYPQIEIHSISMLTKSLTRKITKNAFWNHNFYKLFIDLFDENHKKVLQIPEDENFPWSSHSPAYVIASFLVWLVCFYPLY